MNYAKLAARLHAAQTRSELYHAIVNTPFEFKVEIAYLFLGVIVLSIANNEKGVINRVALSDTEFSRNIARVSVKQFTDIVIPLHYDDNFIVQSIHTGKPRETTDWKDILMPALTAKEAELNQASGGIAFSAIYPLGGLPDGGALIFNYYQYQEEIGKKQYEFMAAYSKIVSDSLARYQEVPVN